MMSENRIVQCPDILWDEPVTENNSDPQRLCNLSIVDGGYAGGFPILITCNKWDATEMELAEDDSVVLGLKGYRLLPHYPLLGDVIPGATARDTNGNMIPARIGQIYVPGAVVPTGQPGAGSRIAFANNVIPTALINPVAKAALAYYPLVRRHADAETCATSERGRDALQQRRRIVLRWL